MVGVVDLAEGVELIEAERAQRLELGVSGVGSRGSPHDERRVDQMACCIQATCAEPDLCGDPLDAAERGARREDGQEPEEALLGCLEQVVRPFDGGAQGAVPALTA